MSSFRGAAYFDKHSATLDNSILTIMSHQPIKEVTPLRETECFTVFYRVKDKFDFPYHYHEEFELNMILNASGAQRVVGDRIDEIGDYELVLTGPNLPHGWFNYNCKSKSGRGRNGKEPVRTLWESITETPKYDD
ncbi:hypothetical protein [Sphingobacterium siyangense]|uniref:hypothetical protein n=1 Tax=Sphingobacterium siyangense TaxID=459529 RepID=UPI003DA3ABCF